MVHDNDSVSPHGERRIRSLTDADIDHIVARINETRHLDCRFDKIEVEDLEEAVKFYKNFNRLMAESGTTMWKAFLVLVLTGTISLVILGIYAKVKHGITIS